METTQDLMDLINTCGVAKSTDMTKVPNATEIANILGELGFTAAALNVEKRLRPAIKKVDIAASGYIEITPDKINAFLMRKVEEYNSHRPKKSKKNVETGGGLNSDIMSQYYANIQNFGNQAFGTTFLYGGTTSTTSAYEQLAVTPASRPAQQSVIPTSFVIRTDDYSNTSPGTIGKFEWLEVGIQQYAGIPPTNVLTKLRETIGKKLFDYFTVASVNSMRDPLLLGRIQDSESRYFIGQWGDDVSLDDVI